MPILADLEVQLENLDAEVRVAWEDAGARLGGARRVKLGDLNLRDDLYREMQPIFRTLYHEPILRRAYFRADNKGRRSRRLLLIFMSELVYWEYERSFWDKLDEVLEIRKRNWHWFTDQMRSGYWENNIPLITWTGRNEYVRTIIGESGFSRRLVQQAKRFVFWFFDHYSDLDPRSLDAKPFDGILDEYGVWNKAEMFDLLRDMVGAVSRLLREIRKRSLASADLRDANVLTELEEALGFHPVRGVFGFRRREDIQELLEQLCTRVKPEAFYTMLRRKTRRSRATLWITTPEGQAIKVRRAKDVPIVFGEYRMLDPYQSEIQVVPREALALSKLAEMIERPQRVFHQDGPTYAWIHDDEPFEIYQGSAEPEEPRRYCVAGLTGYLWYGKQKIGMPLRAERDGQVLSELDPRRDVWLNPRLRLNWDGTGLEVVIPSFICYEPDFFGRTVRLELNGRPIEDTTYVIGRDGFLHFQGTRVAEVYPEDKHLEVCLVTLDGNDTVTRSTVYTSLERDFLFSRGNRELVRPGYQHYGGDRFVLFTATGAPVEIGKAVERESSDDFGPFKILHLRWIPDPSDPQPFELKVGNLHWSFTRPLEIYASLLCTPSYGIFQPQESNSAFDPTDVQIRLHLRGQPDQASEVWPKLSLIIEKDGEFMTDFSLTELERMEVLRSDSAKNELVLDVRSVVSYLVGQRLTDRQIGTYRWMLMLRPHPLADLEPLSEMEFMLLPSLRAEGLDVAMTEGEEALITVFCDSPVLADEEDRSTDVLQLDCKPEAHFDTKTGYLEPNPVERTLRLTYPLTKVTLRFVPRLFAIRLVSQGRVQSRPRVTRPEAARSYLAVLAPPDQPVRIVGPGLEELIKTDNDGRARYALDRLLPVVREERTQVDVACGDAQQQFHIAWYPTLRFDPEQCHLKTTSDETSTLVLHFDVEGPPDTEVAFSLTDNRFQSHGQYIFVLANLNGGTAELPVDLRELQDAAMLFCTADAGGKKQDSVCVLRKDAAQKEAEGQLSEELGRIASCLHQANAQELLELLRLLEGLEQPSIMQQALQRMYSIRCLDQVYEEFKHGRMSGKEITAYFKHFQPPMFPDVQRMPIPKLKKCCAIPAPKLQTACAEALILQGDGVGVEEIIELLAENKISWDRGMEILSENRQCASNMIRDMVQWDDLELEDDDRIELMEKLSRIYHPAMARRARAAKDWKRALTLLRSEQIIDVKVVSSNPNGLIVPMGLVLGQVPIEELDTRRHGLIGSRKVIRRQLPQMVNTALKVIVIEVNRREGRLILSERRARARMAEVLLLELKEGDVRQGVVTNIRDFGVFVDLGGIDGLVHVSELSWDKVEHPNKLFSIDDQVNFYVLGVDRERRRVQLSLKRLLPDPWLQTVHKYQIGQLVQGHVTKVVEFGVFVSVEGEVDGLVHISELTTKHITHPCEVVRRGDMLTLRVLRVDEEKRRLLLSLRQVGEDNLYWGRMKVRS